MFTEISLNLNSHDAELLSDYFFNHADVLSVSIEDQHEGTAKEEAIFGEPDQNTGIEDTILWSHSIIKILLSQDTDSQKIMDEAKGVIAQTELPYTIQTIADQDWVRLTQSQFAPIKINDKLYIVPSWHETPNKAATTIILDPGVAFGTGSHPTTFMCLDWLSYNVTPDVTVLDYGCGSGILAICAKKLGAAAVFGTDIDPQAVEASQANAAHNNVQVEFCLPNKLPTDKQFDVVVANILSNPLRILAPALAAKTKTQLILSGILESQVAELSAIYKQYFRHVELANTIDEWALLHAYN